MGKYSTGNRVVDEVSQLHITGNVLPDAWYRTITRPNGKPDLTAIVILADVVYWYRAGEQRDEGTGEVVRRYARFAADKLQRSYQQLADRFGIGKEEARNAVERLRDLGVITTELRTISVGGRAQSNTLFIEVVPGRLRELTYPTEQPHLPGRVENSVENSERNVENSERNVENSGSVENPVEKSVENSGKRGAVVSSTEGAVGARTDTYTETTLTEIKDLKPCAIPTDTGEGVRRGVSSRATPPAPAQAPDKTDAPSQGYDWSPAEGGYVRSRRLASLPTYPDEVPCACGCTARKAQRLPSCRTYVCDSCGAVWQEPAVTAPQSPKIGAFGDGWE